MNKNEYLDRLSRLLSDISYEEHEEALSYYREYIEDAGAENEQRVIEELGTPEQLAAEIREGLLNNGETGKRCGDMPEAVTGNYRAESASTGNSGPYQNNSCNDTSYDNKGYDNGRFYRTYNNNRQQNPENDKSKIILIILLLIATSPIWLSIVFSCTVTVFACVAAVAAAGIVCIVTGIALIAIGIPPLFTISAVNSLTGLALVGAGLITAALGILFIVLTVWLFGWAFPALIRFIRHTVSNVSRRKEAHV